MKATAVLIVTSLLACLMNSCTVQKRIHRKGWHVEWKQNFKKAGGHEEITEHSKELTNQTTAQITEDNTPISRIIATEEDEDSAEKSSEDLRSTLFVAPQHDQNVNPKISSTQETSTAQRSSSTLDRMVDTDNGTSIYIFSIIFVLLAITLLILYLVLEFSVISTLAEIGLLLLSLIGVLVLFIILLTLLSSLANYLNRKNQTPSTDPDNPKIRVVTEDEHLKETEVKIEEVAEVPLTEDEISKKAKTIKTNKIVGVILIAIFAGLAAFLTFDL